MPFSAYQSVVEHDLFELLLAGQHGGEQDAVVVGMRLGAEHRDVVGSLVSEQLFEGSYAGHAVADHHQFEFLHARSPCHPVRRLACSNSFQQQKASHRFSGEDAFVRVPLSRETCRSTLRSGRMSSSTFALQSLCQF